MVLDFGEIIASRLAQQQLAPSRLSAPGVITPPVPKSLGEQLIQGFGAASEIDLLTRAQETREQKLQAEIEDAQRDRADEELTRAIEAQQLEVQREATRGLSETLAGEEIPGFGVLTQPVLERMLQDPDTREQLLEAVTREDPTLNVERVVDPDGTVRFVSREEAIGREAEPKTPLVTIDQAGEDVRSELQKARGKGQADAFIKTRQLAAKGQDKLDDMAIARTLLERGTSSGPLTELTLPLRAALASTFGIGDIEEISDQELIRKLNIEGAREDVLPGERLTDKDQETLQEANFGLGKTREGNLNVILVEEGKSRRDIALSIEQERYLNDPTRPEKERDTLDGWAEHSFEWRTENPIESFMPREFYKEGELGGVAPGVETTQAINQSTDAAEIRRLSGLGGGVPSTAIAVPEPGLGLLGE